ncbi:hypothetical protein U6A24_15210 [Aquimarina gracilis]|uniref:HTH domain-containing protein n=1 Tax=Aquimarina gracilis TaxID=874422 RepID=A0ABU5ZY80_9FLAO|nr:hypothetical protein [Aquimarina gracilis]MEB3346826.1 hypothetical protein [Aquimarina gracilis]
MSMIMKQIEMIERIDRLIRLQATGSPDQLAIRLGVSKAKVYRVISTMRSLNAPILYDVSIQSFVYEALVGFRFGFYAKEAHHNELPTYA